MMTTQSESKVTKKIQRGIQHRRARKAKLRPTWVATYAIDPAVTWVIPWIRALPDLVAFGSFSTELGDVKMCL